jgi:alanyl-tRNA synthetase
MRRGRLTGGAVLKGETAFRLYDTYGFPLDLTQDALRSRGFSVDVDGFNTAMAKQKADARAAWAGSGEAATETVWFGIKERTGASEFLGYDTESAEGVVTALLRDGVEVVELKAGETGFVVLNQTPFYGESGGQVGDAGVMAGEGIEIEVSDTQKRLGDVVVHAVKLIKGAIRQGTPLNLIVDKSRRGAIRSNHSATHLLHEALRHVLGDHVAQKGSLVSQDRLRFDISHPKPVSDDELAAVEDVGQRHGSAEFCRRHPADGGR